MGSVGGSVEILGNHFGLDRSASRPFPVGSIPTPCIVPHPKTTILIRAEEPETRVNSKENPALNCAKETKTPYRSAK